MVTATTASGAGARFMSWGARVQTLLIPLMIAGSVLSSGKTVLVPRSARQVAAMVPHGPLKDLHPSRRTLNRWKKHFAEYGEMPFETLRYEARRGRRRRCTAATKAVVGSLRRALEAHPEFYLDEFRDYVLEELGYAPSCSSIHRILVHRLQYRLLVVNEMARQRNSAERLRYREDIAAVPDPAMLIFLDETHKDRNAARRRRAWGPRGKRVDVSRTFCPGGESRYTLLAVRQSSAPLRCL